MFGLIFIYFIGKYFYTLSEEFEKNKWLYALLGVSAYYLSGFFIAGLLFIIIDVFNPGYLDRLSDMQANIISIPFCIMGCFLFYKFLEKKWKKEVAENVNEIDQIGSNLEE